MHISYAQADAGVGGETYAHFGQSFTGFTVPAKGTANSGKFGNVVLTKGALLSLPIVPLGHLDVFATATVMYVFDSMTKGRADFDARELLRISDGGYTIPWLHLKQLNVPTTYDLAGLSLDDISGIANLTTKAPLAAAIDVSMAAGIAGGSLKPQIQDTRAN
jgi:hypothetical protein